MRLATLGVAVVLMVGMTPALAHTASTARENGDEYHTTEDGTYHEITSDIPYKDEMILDHDAYVKQGYWSGGCLDPVSSGIVCDPVPDTRGLLGSGTEASVEDSDVQERENITWLSITPGTEMPALSYDITVTVEGPVVAALDVFEIRPEGTAMTPDCPQYLVDDRLPDQGEGLGYAFRVLQETNKHQRSTGFVGSSTMSVSLSPSASPSGYIVAVYPQTQSSYTGQEAKITTEVGIGGENEQFTLREHKQAQQQPDQPFHLDEWVGSPVSDVYYCGGEGIDLPFGIGDGNTAEMPGTGPLEERINRLLGTAIEEAAPEEGEA